MKARGLRGAGWYGGWDQVGAQGGAQGRPVLGAEPASGRRAEGQSVRADGGPSVGEVGQVVKVGVGNH